MLADLFAADPDRSITDLLLVIGRWLPKRRDARGYLVVEALVAARRDEDVARLMRDYVGERADWLAELVRAGQSTGELDPSLSPDAVAHFCLLLGMGSALIPPDLHAVDDDEWAALLSRVVRAPAPTTDTHRTETGTHQPVKSADRLRALPGTRPLLRPRAPSCSPRTKRATARSSATALSQPRTSTRRGWRSANCPENAIDVLEEA